MAEFKCGICGATAEGRCKPKKCKKCGEENVMIKQEAGKTSACGCRCGNK